MSGIGKGITSSSIALLLKEGGAAVNMAKIDPYLNVDAGTMNPFEHGECFVLEDGMEADLDLGNYERFLERPLTAASSITTGQVFTEVLAKERAGAFLGKTVQIVPDVTDAIIRRLDALCAGYDYLVVELGGTVGDMESLPFYMALRQMQLQRGRAAFVCVHVSCLLTEALKTKPTQHSVQELNRQGIFPDVLCLRLPAGRSTIPDATRAKLALRCGVKTVVANPTCGSIYEVPHVFLREGLLGAICPAMRPPALAAYESLAVLRVHPWRRVAVVGKYTSEEDAYLSVRRALDHAFGAAGTRVAVDWVDADALVAKEWCDGEEGEGVGVDGLGGGKSGLGGVGGKGVSEDGDAPARSHPFPYDGVIIPGGFGARGTDAMLRVIATCRRRGVPTLGICLGFQLMVVDWARAAGHPTATSEEFGTGSPRDWVIRLHTDQAEGGAMGGTLRKGGFDIRVDTARHPLLRRLCAGEVCAEGYLGSGAEEGGECGGDGVTGDTALLHQRFRYRYEVNPSWVEPGSDASVSFTGYVRGSRCMADSDVPNIFLRHDHPFFLGTQSHPEFTSNLTHPSPFFTLFVEAVLHHH